MKGRGGKLTALHSCTSHRRSKWRSHSLPESFAGPKTLDPAEARIMFAPKYDQDPENPEKPPEMILQRSTGPIGAQQIREESETIYETVEQLEEHTKYITRPHLKHNTHLGPEECKNLIAVCKRFVNTAHDLMLACQHPAAEPSLRALPKLKGIPIRVWKTGIHTPLELFRHRLPECKEQLDLYVRNSYAIVGLFYESLLDSDLIWLECLGDLARYMMVIEEDAGYRAIMNKTAHAWYQQVLDSTPTIGRLSHHQAVLSGSAPLKQLVYYIVALSTEQPFLAARQSIASFFARVLKSSESMLKKNSSSYTELMLLRLHALYFVRASAEELCDPVQKFTRNFHGYIHARDRNFKETGFLLAITRTAFLLDQPVPSNSGTTHVYLKVNGLRAGESVYSQPTEPERKTTSTSGARRSSAALKSYSSATPQGRSEIPGTAEKTASGLSQAYSPFPIVPFIFTTLRTVYELAPTANLLPYVHGTLVSLLHLASDPKALAWVTHLVPWDVIAEFLWQMEVSMGEGVRASDSAQFPDPRADGFACKRALPEDYLLARLVWAKGYLPEKHFEDYGVSQDERDVQNPTMDVERVRRCLHLAWRITAVGRHRPLMFDEDNVIREVIAAPTPTVTIRAPSTKMHMYSPDTPVPIYAAEAGPPSIAAESEFSAGDLGDSAMWSKGGISNITRSTSPSTMGPSRAPSRARSDMMDVSEAGDLSRFVKEFPAIAPARTQSHLTLPHAFQTPTAMHSSLVLPTRGMEEHGQGSKTRPTHGLGSQPRRSWTFDTHNRTGEGDGGPEKQWLGHQEARPHEAGKAQHSKLRLELDGGREQHHGAGIGQDDGDRRGEDSGQHIGSDHGLEMKLDGA